MPALKWTLNKQLKKIVCYLLIITPFSPLRADTTIKSFDATSIHWSKLTYSTSVLFFFNLSADVYFRLVNSESITPKLIRSKEGKGISPKHEKSVLLTMISNNLGRKSQLDLWLDTDLTALQRTQLDTNRRYRRKTFRFLENGVYSLENKPLKKEKKLSVDNWSKKSEQFYPADVDFTGQPLTDDVALFYAISAAKLYKPGDQIEVYTFDKKENYVVTVAAIEMADLDVEYIEEHRGNFRAVKGEVATLKLLLTAKPFKNTENVETKFLNLSKGIHIYLDVKTRAILQISANVKYIGRIHIKLNRMQLNK